MSGTTLTHSTPLHTQADVPVHLQHATTADSTAPLRAPASLSAGKIWVYILGEMAGGACAGLLSWPLCEWDMCSLRSHRLHLAHIC